MSTTTGVEANERLALLMGWEHRESDGWWQRSTDGACAGPPDYLHDWSRFPELQAYVRGLPTIRRQMLWPLVRDAAGISFHHEALTNITPEILGNALLEVCDE